MPKFSVTAVTKDGEEYRETVEAASRFEVYRDMRTRGDRVISLVSSASGILGRAQNYLDRFGTVSVDEKVSFARTMAAMLAAGLSTTRALSVIERQTRNRTFKAVLSDVIGGVKRGSALSVALSAAPRVFPPFLISMVRAGEESGNLSESLKAVADQLAKMHALASRIRGAMIYPAIVVSAMVGIGVLMLMFVVPTLSQTFAEAGATLPIQTRIIISASNFLISNSLFAVLLALLGAVAVGSALRTARGARALAWMVLHTPLIRNIAAEMYAARTARTLSSLLSAGVDMLGALAITRDVVGNPFHRDALASASVAVERGEGLAGALHLYPHLYPPLLIEMTAVGEETGRLSALLAEAAQFYEESVDARTRNLSTVIEPLLMVVIGGFVGFFALSMIAPIYSLSSSF